MAKTIFEEMGGKYERQGDYLIPCLTVSAEEEQPIGIWGQRHLDYLKHQEVKGDYINAVTTKLKIEEIYYNDDPQSLFAEDERLELIYKEMDKLPDKCREIFTMSYLEERKTSEIAVLLNISTRTVEAQLYKALKILRGILLSCLIFLSNF